jgi:biopolymer transport protein ExbD
VFLLIIFFLVASYFIRSEQSRSVNLPSAGHGERDEEQSAQHLTITLEPDGQYSVAGQPCTEDAILNRLRQLSSNRLEGDVSAQVRIRADRKAHFAEIRRLIELCSSNQIVSIRFAVTTQSR